MSIKIKIILSALIIGLATSCGSKKRVVNNKPPEVVTVEAKPTKPIFFNKQAYVNSLKTENIKLNTATLNYIETYASIAIKEMQLYKIPASITLAQGILESGNGKSILAAKSNNHFGIKCHSQWQGARVYHDDDAKGECFRKYNNPETSFKDHSLFLAKRRRYAFLFDYKITDYKKWAYGLRKAGYATDKRYPKKLLHLIKTYKLYYFDTPKKAATFLDVTQLPNTTTNLPATAPKTTTNYTVLKGDTLYSLSKKFNVSVARLKVINNLSSNDISIGQTLVIKK